MTRAEEILSDISDRDCNHFFCQMGCENKLSPKKLATYLATLESSKGEEKERFNVYKGSLTNHLTGEVMRPLHPEEREDFFDVLNDSKDVDIPYVEDGEDTPPSEEKKEIQDPVLRLLLETFEKLSEEDKKKIRDGMDTKLREIGHGHVKNLVSYLGTQGKCCEKCFATSQVFGFCSNKDCPCHAPSEEKKCEETFEAANLKGRCKLLEGHEGIHQPELVSPTQEEKQRKMIDANLEYIANTPDQFPTPPDAWETSQDYKQAIFAANKALDNPHIDPDGDISTIARQFLRMIERYAVLKEKL